MRGQEPARARLRHDPAAGEDEPDLRALGGEADVHRQRHRDPDSDRRAVDRRDHRLGGLVDAQRDPPASVAGDLVRLLAVAPVERVAAAGQVGPRTEPPSLPGHDDRAHVVVGVGPVEGLDQLASHRRRERVQPVGPVERDGQHVVGDLVADVLEAHAVGSFSRPARTRRGRPRAVRRRYVLHSHGHWFGSLPFSSTYQFVQPVCQTVPGQRGAQLAVERARRPRGGPRSGARRRARARRSAAITCAIAGLDRVDHRARAAVRVRPVEQEHVREAGDGHARGRRAATSAHSSASVRPPAPAISIGATKPCVLKPVASTSTSAGRSRAVGGADRRPA